MKICSRYERYEIILSKIICQSWSAVQNIDTDTACICESLMSF